MEANVTRSIEIDLAFGPVSRIRPLGKKLSASGLCLVPVILDVLLRRFRSMMRCMMEVTLSGVRVVRRHFVVAFFVVRRRFAVMTRCVFVMFRCLVMMLCRLLRHRSSSFRCSAGLAGPR